MREVAFNKWIGRIYDENGKVEQGTGVWEKDFKNKGVFHEWGVCYEETENSLGNYSVALVEMKDGTIESVLPSNIKFTNPY